MGVCETEVTTETVKQKFTDSMSRMVHRNSHLRDLKNSNLSSFNHGSETLRIYRVKSHGLPVQLIYKSSVRTHKKTSLFSSGLSVSMGSRVTATFFVFMILSLTALPPLHACGYCKNPPYQHPSPPVTGHPPHRPSVHPPYNNPPMPPIITIPPPSSTYPPYTGNPPSGGRGGGRGGGGGGLPGICPPPPPISPTCPINVLKLGLCVDLLGGLVHIGIGNPVENACCPVLQGLLELEAAICLCTTIKLKLLNLNIFLPLALQVLITCGKNPPPGFVCPPLQ
ncbi:hypothetical protein NE237_029613 [Protea cynaroides]|uniref:Bifunctional inhibitor/plant lipid transfer protein/seed storage helical domain-containing protein n=1 Tax=Protea cynaroides TaxID=273540 RepID=A0A9Q0GTH4_9MAGN|nr:hypothetical protein NE237_029613 [Protea cynaroides]